MKIIRNFLTVCASTLGSRFLGFIRETLVAATLGVGKVTDVFYVAFYLTFIFRRLAAEGIFHNSFIPLFSQEKENNGSESAQRLSSEIFSILILSLVVLTVVVELILPLLIRFIIAPGFADQSDKYFLTIQLSRVMFPSIIFISLASLVTGMLFALGRYFIASIAPIVINVFPIFALTYALWHPSSPQETTYLLAWGVFLSNVVHFWIVYCCAKNDGVKLRFQYPRLTHNVKFFLKLTFPLMVTGGIIQISNIVGRAIASRETGIISAIQYAERIYSLPVGVIGGAMMIVILPALSRSLRSKNKQKSFELQNQAIECISFFGIPSAVALFMLSKEIVQTLYERGAFSSQNTILVSSFLSIYSIGILANILSKSLSTAFYAQNDMKAPMKFTIVSIAINLTIAIGSFPFIGGYGIALAEVSSSWVNTICLAITLLKRKQINLPFKTIYRILSVSISAGLMGFFIILFRPYFNQFSSATTFFDPFKNLVIMLSGAMLVYLFSIFLFLGKDFLSPLQQMIRK
ncbi:murein biosynthesis integral membrane protein MurJ [Candidatus Liberibacter asiaticus]|uniref:Probable lipid II flippase MurJ n=2 Tax=Liberibacter asiaticus TaxID=34021 RepID=C6XFW3_LIBAP|nr:murein biosynthesis integral membrane protein MurJ [Candidatus Liberibacter asiaticus]ACT57266.1 integral membrane protein MviN [Candidatus Liberibacter asiaticus str. psy62]AGH16769.1 integral membrane protein MviN [Candidatus Liberibacter asiaticus str. gxpsy]ALK07138.1 murein biosynthesis integral membrane protein MurJ [Candidatus Liberibacter asiaticus]ASK52614.1 lipid II flippase MurJ [Candidatus Liberibacter asiaticus]AWL13939.1 murein biosynthesis integral membrane protein MurJ [Cand